MRAAPHASVLVSRLVSTGKLTRQELGWLLTQEAQGAAERLRMGVQILKSNVPPPPDSASGGGAPQVDATLDALDERLSQRRYLFGAQPLETDWRLFVTLVRFDAVYHGHFKCNIRRIVDYPNLSGYVRDLYQIDGVAATVNFDHIKRHYYATHDDINPTRIVPIGPLQDLLAPHGRERLA